MGARLIARHLELGVDALNARMVLAKHEHWLQTLFVSEILRTVVGCRLSVVGSLISLFAFI